VIEPCFDIGLPVSPELLLACARSEPAIERTDAVFEVERSLPALLASLGLVVIADE
jgi:hypothetical protein